MSATGKIRRRMFLSFQSSEHLRQARSCDEAQQHPDHLQRSSGQEGNPPSTKQVQRLWCGAARHISIITYQFHCVAAGVNMYICT